jgi:hypothetical protein
MRPALDREKVELADQVAEGDCAAAAHQLCNGEIGGPKSHWIS